MPDLSKLLEQHLTDLFPDTVIKGTDYGEVDAVMIGADIYGWALQVSRGLHLSVVDLERLSNARDSLQRSHRVP